MCVHLHAQMKRHMYTHPYTIRTDNTLAQEGVRVEWQRCPNTDPTRVTLSFFKRNVCIRAVVYFMRPREAHHRESRRGERINTVSAGILHLAHSLKANSGPGLCERWVRLTATERGAHLQFVSFVSQKKQANKSKISPFLFHRSSSVLIEMNSQRQDIMSDSVYSLNNLCCHVLAGAQINNDNNNNRGV